jgi:hypothetical protein
MVAEHIAPFVAEVLKLFFDKFLHELLRPQGNAKYFYTVFRVPGRSGVLIVVWVGEDVGRLDSERDVGLTALGLLVVVSSGTKQDLDSAELDAVVRTYPLSGFDGVNAVVMRAPPVDVVTVRRDELTRRGHVFLDQLEGTEGTKSMEECGRSASLVTTQLRENLLCGIVIHIEPHRCTLPVNSIEAFEYTRNFSRIWRRASLRLKF